MSRRSGDKLFQRQKELEKKDFKRQGENKSKIPDVIIACEDSVSSPTYFRMIVEKLIREKIITQNSFVVAIQRHTNPFGVLQDLKNHKCDDGKTYKNFEYKWIVIDRDIERVNGGGHTKEDFNNAINEAKRLKVDVAYSNDSFELWCLLHFDALNTPFLRDEINIRLIEKLKIKNSYKFIKLDKKNIKEANYTKHIFDELLPLQDKAIKNAEILLLSYEDSHNPEKDNPSTTIHKLVKILNGLGKKEEEKTIEE